MAKVSKNRALQVFESLETASFARSIAYAGTRSSFGKDSYQPYFTMQSEYLGLGSDSNLSRKPYLDSPRYIENFWTMQIP